MTAPLYAQCEPPGSRDETGHAGLWFERFFDQYNAETWKILEPETSDQDKGNSHWLLKHFHNKKVGNHTHLIRHGQQQRLLIQSLQGAQCIFKSTWHFVTGMGNAHPVNNGFAWHPTLGVPYLTGAAVKGLVRTYIEEYLDDTTQARKQLLLDWFGSNDKNPQAEGYQSQAGELIFFEATPIKPVRLVVDVMTPHMGNWYQDGGSAVKANQADTIPADWHNPVPVSFLAAQDISLLFSFALRQYPTVKQRQPLDLDDVTETLCLALQHLGSGGKTTTGYGAMVRDLSAEAEFHQVSKRLAAEEKAAKERQNQEVARQAELVKMNPLERKIAEFPKVIDAIKALEAGQWQIESQLAAQYLKVRMQKEKIWKESSAKRNPKKDKSYQLTLRVKKYFTNNE